MFQLVHRLPRWFAVILNRYSGRIHLIQNLTKVANLKMLFCLILLAVLCPDLASSFSYKFKIVTGNQTFEGIDANFELTLDSFSLNHQRDEPLVYSNTM